MSGQAWSPSGYALHAGFVPELGGEILAWLSPKEGERILDLGCGDGALTARIASTGAEVVGIDASEAMVAAARARGLDARQGAGEALGFRGEFDAVFSNAALHWMPDASAVAAGIAQALRPGGRMVAEFGGHLNVASIATALRAAVQRFGGEVGEAAPWYFPTEKEYADVLAQAGLSVMRSAVVPRPTPLPTDMGGWLDTFAGGYLDRFEGSRRAEVKAYVLDLLAPSLRDKAGNWTADYVRLRVEARKAP